MKKLSDNKLPPKYQRSEYTIRIKNLLPLQQKQGQRASLSINPLRTQKSRLPSRVELNDSQRKSIASFLQKINEEGDEIAISELVDKVVSPIISSNKNSELVPRRMLSLDSLKSQESFCLDDTALWEDSKHSYEGESQEDESDDSDSDCCNVLRENEEVYRKYMIDLGGDFKLIWDQIQLVLMIYVSIVVPFKICFIEDGEYPLWDFTDYIVDSIFAIDIILTFFIPITKKELIIYSHLKIALHYLKLWFWVDIISIFPVELVFTTIGSKNYTYLVRISKFPRLYKFLRGAKLLRTIKMKKKGKKSVIAKFITYLISSKHLFLQIIPIYLIGLVLAHLFACLWYFLASNSESSDNWLVVTDYIDERTFDKYCAAAYFVYTTMTTTGYGDIVPRTMNEYLFSVILTFTGVTFFSLIYSSMIKKHKEYAELQGAFAAKRSFLNDLYKMKIISPQINKEMLMIINEHLIHNLEEKDSKRPLFKGVKPAYVLKMYSEVCKNQHKFHINRFFKTFPKRVWVQFFEVMEEQIYTRGECIYPEGEQVGSFYVIRRGKVWLSHHFEEPGDGQIKQSSSKIDDSEKPTLYPFIELDSCFGEREILNGEPFRKYTCVAKKNLHIYRVGKGDFNKIFGREPYAKLFFRLFKKRERRIRRAITDCKELIIKNKKISQKLEKRRSQMINSVRKSIQEGRREGGKDWYKDLVLFRKKIGIVEPNVTDSSKKNTVFRKPSPPERKIELISTLHNNYLN